MSLSYPLFPLMHLENIILSVCAGAKRLVETKLGSPLLTSAMLTFSCSGWLRFGEEEQTGSEDYVNLIHIEGVLNHSVVTNSNPRLLLGAMCDSAPLVWCHALPLSVCVYSRFPCLLKWNSVEHFERIPSTWRGYHGTS
jgi:hypothetical protein